MNNNKINVKSLGKKIPIPSEPNINILEKIQNPREGYNYCVRLTCPEFTSICPVTSQPDFANLIIDYIPKKFIVESKSFKLFLLSFRNHGAFHEDCTLNIGITLNKLLKPNWLRIAGFWFPRGGIPIDVFWETGKKPNYTFIPKLKLNNYKGRF